MSTKIPWVQNPDGSPGETVNPVTGCTPVSPGCAHCYAAGLASTRLAHLPAYRGLARNGQWTGEVRWNPDALLKPMRRKKPTGYFWGDMGDLFHEKVTDEQIAACFGVMAATKQHRHYLLTKRPERMRAWFEAHPSRIRGSGYKGETWDCRPNDCFAAATVAAPAIKWSDWEREFLEKGYSVPWPLPNVYLGTTVEDQPRAEERIPHLLACPAAVRFLSVEPLLGAVDLDLRPAKSRHGADGVDHSFKTSHIDWVIVGGESGRGARPMHPDWARGIRDQCVAAGVPFFFKQWGEWAPFYDLEKDDPDCRRVPARSDRVCRRNLAGGVGFHGDRVVYFLRMGARAGRVLDAQEWRQMPAVRS